MSTSAAEAVRRKGVVDGVIGWKLDRGERSELLERFPAAYPNVDVDHVTLASGAGPDGPLPEETTGEIVGRTDDGEGVEAMVVRISGATDRPGGGTYHITWSVGPGRHARESNDVLARQGWEALDRPIPVRLAPARLR